MEILLWLVPSVVVTVLAMLWVGWLGEGRGEVDRDVAVRRLAAASSRTNGAVVPPPATPSGSPTRTAPPASRCAPRAVFLTRAPELGGLRGLPP